MNENQHNELRIAIRHLHEALGILEHLHRELPEAGRTILPSDRDVIEDAEIALGDLIDELETI